MTLMAVQAGLGLLMPGEYRDPAWITATWFGNDWITLVAAVPLLWFGILRARGGSMRGQLLVLGMGAYAVYNYAFYLFGAALNGFFVLYVLNFLLGIVTLGVMLGNIDAGAVAMSFREQTPVRLVAGYLVFVAVSLSAVWLGMWGAYAFAGRPTPIDPEAFKVVAALDLSLMVPALASGGVLLWKRRPWGYVIATVASIQGALYLIVLSVNSVVLINRGLAAAPGELPLWGPLAASTTIAAIVLLRSASRHRRSTSRPA
jgi:hypothetical protein